MAPAATTPAANSGRLYSDDPTTQNQGAALSIELNDLRSSAPLPNPHKAETNTSERTSTGTVGTTETTRRSWSTQQGVSTKPTSAGVSQPPPEDDTKEDGGREVTPSVASSNAAYCGGSIGHSEAASIAGTDVVGADANPQRDWREHLMSGIGLWFENELVGNVEAPQATDLGDDELYDGATPGGTTRPSFTAEQVDRESQRMLPERSTVGIIGAMSADAAVSDAEASGSSAVNNDEIDMESIARDTARPPFAADDPAFRAHTVLPERDNAGITRIATGIARTDDAPNDDAHSLRRRQTVPHDDGFRRAEEGRVSETANDDGYRPFSPCRKTLIILLGLAGILDIALAAWQVTCRGPTDLIAAKRWLAGSTATALASAGGLMFAAERQLIEILVMGILVMSIGGLCIREVDSLFYTAKATQHVG